MKNNNFRVFFLLHVLLLTGSCTTVTNKSDCKKDMNVLGFEHGSRGHSNLSDEVRKVCGTNEKTLNYDSYQKGFITGWINYCTPFRGFEMGKKGDIYKSYCPAEKEALFHEKFLTGKRLVDKKDQVNDLEEKIKELSSNSEKDLPVQAELKKLQENLRDLNRDIQRLEQDGKSQIHTN